MTDNAMSPLLAPDAALADPASLALRFADERAADIVEALDGLDPAVAAAVLLHLPPERAVEVLDQPGLDQTPGIVAALPRERAAALLAGMSADESMRSFGVIRPPSW